MRASTTRHAALSKAKKTLIQKCPAVAAATMPTPIRPNANIGPPAMTTGEEAAHSAIMIKAGTATPVRNAVPQAGLSVLGHSLDVNRLMAAMLTEAPGVVDRLRIEHGTFD